MMENQTEKGLEKRLQEAKVSDDMLGDVSAGVGQNDFESVRRGNSALTEVDEDGIDIGGMYCLQWDGRGDGMNSWH